MYSIGLKKTSTWNRGHVLHSVFAPILIFNRNFSHTYAHNEQKFAILKAKANKYRFQLTDVSNHVHLLEWNVMDFRIIFLAITLHFCSFPNFMI